MNEIIKIEGLRKRFGDNEVLKGITTSVKKGEVVAIIGPSGCGKSTFLRSINLLEEPTKGKIYIDGMDITSWDVDINKMRQRVGMVFQQFNLFPNMTIRRNIMLAPVELGKMTREEGNGTPDPYRTAGQGRQLSRQSFGWTEAACGNRPCPGDESRGAPL